jgi:hypothetical protein
MEAVLTLGVFWYISGTHIQGLRFGVRGSGFGVWGLGFGV